MISELDKTTFIKGLEEFQSKATQKEPAWLKDVRKKGWQRFKTLGVPTVKDEEWKYTNIASLAQNTFEIQTTDGQIKANETLKKYIDSGDLTIVFVNGIFSASLSNLKSLPKGLTLLTIDEAASQEHLDVEKLVKRYETNRETSFVALNEALHQGGAYIKVEKKAVIEKIIHIVHITGIAGTQVMTSPRTLIELDASSEVTILESYLSPSNDFTYFTNAVTDIFLAENSTARYFKAQSDSTKGFHIGTTRAWQEQNSNFQTFTLTVGGQITRNNLDVILNGEGSSAILDGLYCVRDTQLVDNHTAVDHRVPNCTSNQLYKGILNHASRAVFNGKIFVRPIAQKTNSYQLNKNLLLGENCRVDTKPQLEIGADDVKCTHGATIGQLNEDEIFYLQSRCIPKKTAVKMLSIGFVDDILQNIKDESIHRKFNILLEPTFAALS